MSDFFNRELSWIEFNARVLGEAQNKEVPLLERLLFLGITSSNFDEFFMIRVATVMRQHLSGDFRTVTDFNSSDLIDQISKKAHEIVDEQYRILDEELLPKLKKAGINFKAKIREAEKQYLDRVFEKEIFSILTPLKVDSNKSIHNFGNLQTYLAVILKSQEGGKDEFAMVPVPETLKRFWPLPEGKSGHHYILLEDFINLFAFRLFPGYDIVESSCFRITKDADLAVDEDDDKNFLDAMEQLIVQREKSFPVRLEILDSSARIRERLVELLQINERDVYVVSGPLDLKGLMSLCFHPSYDHLRFDKRRPQLAGDLEPNENIYEALRKKDVLLHHPYESFDPVIQMLEQAADDPQVLSIKMTLYRTSGTKSPIAAALLRAARNGKQVTVLVELKARFDEQQNINWALQLEEVGATVIYGLADLKVHCKFLMVTRRDEDAVRRYLHLGTGNYNEKTAEIYTDLSLMTSREKLTYEAALFFNAITGYSRLRDLDLLSMAPTMMKQSFLTMINREIAIADGGGKAEILAKFNSLSDPEIIKALYKASSSGVKIQLNIRGICMLKPGVSGLSDNISVKSIIGRYLEHSRIYYFRNGGAEEIYLASADWMSRNLDRRVELLFPVLDENHRKRVLEMLKQMFLDDSKSHELQSDGSYKKVSGNKICVHDLFYHEACSKAQKESSDEFKVLRSAPQK